MGGHRFWDIACVCRWYANVLQLHTCLEVERGGARSRAGCPPSESSRAKVHVQPAVTAVWRSGNIPDLTHAGGLR